MVPGNDDRDDKSSVNRQFLDCEARMWPGSTSFLQLDIHRAGSLAQGCSSVHDTPDQAPASRPRTRGTQPGNES